ncbi:DUF4287 domain-containing protein [Sphingomonas sp.]|jgi:hypothetical protein|uniref:DUF4287 domain-containing protein n=1 Tax=Sphingomonas sp. TaxID=28214 RepID=UPI002E0DC560|nr:DUF4287 domain-containing protein [Sphingomonas sp.]
MSFQAYLDTIQQKTGKTPADLRALGRERGWTQGDTLAPGVKPMAIVATLKDELGLGHGHAMAVVALLKGHKKEDDA